MVKRRCEKTNRIESATLKRLAPFVPLSIMALEEYGSDGFMVGKCRCGKAVLSFENYCCYCGQKLDWKNYKGDEA